MPEQSVTVDEVARMLANELEQRGIPYAIGGALALGHWAVPRATFDVDMNIWMEARRPAEVAALLSELNCDFQASAVIREFTSKGTAYVHLQGVRVDLYLPTSDFHKSVLARRRRVPLLGREAWFLSPEDLTIFKMIFFRLRDRANVEAILAVQGERLDRAYMREWLARIVGKHDPRAAALGEMFKDADELRQLSGNQHDM